MEEIRKKFPFVFLFIISLLIIIIAFSFIKLLAIDLHPWGDIPTTIFLVVYGLVFLLLVWSITQAIRRDPGKVPLQWVISIAFRVSRWRVKAKNIV